MIPARHHKLYVAFFEVYARWMMHAHFSKIRCIGSVKLNNLPVMMIGNHFSWWDGFIAGYINMKVLKKKLHIMMLEEELRPRMFLNRTGAYSIRKGSRDMLATIDYTAELLNDSNNLVVMFPQGEFQSIYQHPVTFGRGVQLISSRAGHEFQLLFYAALIDYFSSRKPSLNIYLQEFPAILSQSGASLESAYNEFLSACYKQQVPL